MAKELIYAYCICQKEPNLNFKGSALDNNIYTIQQRGLYTVVSKVSKDEFSDEKLKKNLANLEWIKEKVSIHEKVVEGVMKDACVVPFKFGTIFNSEDNLKAMLKEDEEEFKKNLKNLEGKVEWGLKIYCDIEKLKGIISKGEAEILNIEKEIDPSSPGKAYFLKKKREELIKDAITRRINEYGQGTFELLKGLSLEGRINKLLPKEVTEREDEMVFNSAFLIDKNKELDFIQTADNLKAKYVDEGFNFDCTGPWPPYNFVK